MMTLKEMRERIDKYAASTYAGAVYFHGVLLTKLTKRELALLVEMILNEEKITEDDE